MAGRGRAPKDPVARRRRNVPTRGEWQSSPGISWRDGALPQPPDGLTTASEAAWRVWMTSWIAANWTPADLPGLRLLIRLYDRIERGEFQRASELRLWMDTYGLTPKGRQDRRWSPPHETDFAGSREPKVDRYAHLRLAPPPGDS